MQPPENYQVLAGGVEGRTQPPDICLRFWLAVFGGAAPQKILEVLVGGVEGRSPEKSLRFRLVGFRGAAPIIF